MRQVWQMLSYSVVLVWVLVVHPLLAQNYTDHIDDETAYKKLYYAEKLEHAIADGFIVVFNKTRLEEIWNQPSLSEIVANLSKSEGAIEVQKINSFMGMVVLKVRATNSSGDYNEEKLERKRRLLPWLKNSLVAYMEEDQILNITSDQSFPTWGLDRIDQNVLPLNNQYHYDNNGTGVIAYIVDTGLRSKHADFTGRATCAISFIPNEDCEDGNGHGTHVSGTIGSSTYGVAKGISLVGVKVLSNDGGGANSGVINGIEWVLQQARQDSSGRPKVCNLSLGGRQSRALDNAVTQLVEVGNVFTVVAAGNSNEDACLSSPAAASLQSDVVSVGATDRIDRRAVFSNFGQCVSIFAPGVDIESTWFTSNVAINSISGTSMASPHVAGVGALYLQSNPQATPRQVKRALLSGAVQDLVFDDQNSPNMFVNTEFMFESKPASPPDSGAFSSIFVGYSRHVVTVSAIIFSLLL
jgi:aqualysin 1